MDRLALVVLAVVGSGSACTARGQRDDAASAAGTGSSSGSSGSSSLPTHTGTTAPSSDGSPDGSGDGSPEESGDGSGDGSSSSTGGGLLCPLNEAPLPQASFDSPTIRPGFSGFVFTSEAPCTVAGVIGPGVSLVCPEGTRPGLLHEIDLHVTGVEGLDLAALPQQVTIAFDENAGFESCGSEVLRLSDATTGELLLAVAQRLPGAMIAPLQVALVDTECTAHSPPRHGAHSIECRPGALVFTGPKGELEVADGDSGTLADGQIARVIRARHCQHLPGVPVQDICGTVAFTIAAPTLLAG